MKGYSLRRVPTAARVVVEKGEDVVDMAMLIGVQALGWLRHRSRGEVRCLAAGATPDHGDMICISAQQDGAAVYEAASWREEEDNVHCSRNFGRAQFRHRRWHKQWVALATAAQRARPRRV